MFQCPGGLPILISQSALRLSIHLLLGFVFPEIPEDHFLLGAVLTDPLH
jgi:hypothetical protein